MVRAVSAESKITVDYTAYMKPRCSVSVIKNKPLTGSAPFELTLVLT